MSGIFGYLQNTTGIIENKINIKTMQLWNRAYGKDAEELSEGDCYGIGCCYERLSIERKQSKPVLVKESKYAVIDALLYNRDELLEKCGAETSFSDEELVLAYIDSFGMSGLKDVNGDFCGAIYDTKDKTLVLFRDHMGVRPLFYHANDSFVAFSTDIRGLICVSQIDAAISEDWIFKTIAGYTTIGTENTEYANIFCVNPAGYVKFSFEKGGLSIEKNRYWQLGNKKIRLSSEVAYRDKLKELITDSVKRRLDAVSGLVGAELSGGLDSGVIDILINRLGRECVYFSWSVDPKDLPMAENDERLIIADICKQENITCNFGKQILELDSESNIAENVRQTGTVLQMDELPAMRYVLPSYINALTICEASEHINKSGSRVVFTGHGGDEGVSHRCNSYEMFYNHEYYHYLRYMWSTTHGKKNRIIGTLKKCYKNLSEAQKMLRKPFHNPFGVPELLKADFAGKFDETKMPILHFAYDPKEYVKEGGSRNRLDNVALLGAYSGVRYLIPYLDYRVIDFAVSIPRHLYIKGRRNRYIFREAFKDIMPESLYKLRIKEDNSRKNMEQDPNWFEEYAKKKADTVSKLNREYWSQYLNFDIIDEWLKRGKPSDEERLHDESILICLFLCAMAENVAEKSREI